MSRSTYNHDHSVFLFFWTYSLLYVCFCKLSESNVKLEPNSLYVYMYW